MLYHMAKTFYKCLSRKKCEKKLQVNEQSSKQVTVVSQISACELYEFLLCIMYLSASGFSKNVLSYA